MSVAFAHIYKDEPAPQIKPDNEYPEWLWHVAEPSKTLAHLSAANFFELSLKDKQRYLKLLRRKKIKENNAKAARGF